jgi:hypothetical protein
MDGPRRTLRETPAGSVLGFRLSKKVEVVAFLV